MKVDKKDLICPVCGQHYFEEYDANEVCPVCYWEDDALQRHHPDMLGANGSVSLNQARKDWKEHRNAFYSMRIKEETKGSRPKKSGAFRYKAV